jgi:hypothetical protein
LWTCCLGLKMHFVVLCKPEQRSVTVTQAYFVSKRNPKNYMYKTSCKRGQWYQKSHFSDENRIKKPLLNKKHHLTPNEIVNGKIVKIVEYGYIAKTPDNMSIYISKRTVDRILEMNEEVRIMIIENRYNRLKGILTSRY